ncbi:hypothetical protein Leryth_020935 [Lithospermum erythrorhizon]|uniref:Transmembrane protein n=1 Tax=Lithospermum erythrorhizon TaxID=34254 RepID=A0AAV3P239_LITER|nr:hypothetical protein Leryth_020935 [Lithospermum erythrorhizon]
MDGFNSERSKAWNIYTSSEPTPSQTGIVGNNNEDGSGKNFGTSMNAISFGFVATAILISMFLVMAIFEHLFKPTESYSSSQNNDSSRTLDLRQLQKLRDPEAVPVSYSSDFSVVMPGEHYPTYIAQPAPLPCPREGVHFPPHHQHNLTLSSS